MVPVEATGACGTETPLQDLMGYMRIDATVAAGSPDGASPPLPPPRREERKDAAFSIDRSVDRGAEAREEGVRKTSVQSGDWRSDSEKRSSLLSRRLISPPT